MSVPELLLFAPLWILAVVGLFLVGAVLFIVLLGVSLLDFVVLGPRRETVVADQNHRVCDICGRERSPYPRHRWQIGQYLRWLLQHADSSHRNVVRIR